MDPSGLYVYHWTSKIIMCDVPNISEQDYAELLSASGWIPKNKVDE